MLPSSRRTSTEILSAHGRLFMQIDLVIIFFRLCPAASHPSSSIKVMCITNPSMSLSLNLLPSSSKYRTWDFFTHSRVLTQKSRAIKDARMPSVSTFLDIKPVRLTGFSVVEALTCLRVSKPLRGASSARASVANTASSLASPLASVLIEI